MGARAFAFACWLTNWFRINTIPSSAYTRRARKNKVEKASVVVRAANTERGAEMNNRMGESSM